jgi:hypothetical protein
MVDFPAPEGPQMMIGLGASTDIWFCFVFFFVFFRVSPIRNREMPLSIAEWTDMLYKHHLSRLEYMNAQSKNKAASNVLVMPTFVFEVDQEPGFSVTSNTEAQNINVPTMGMDDSPQNSKNESDSEYPPTLDAALKRPSERKSLYMSFAHVCRLNI